MGGHRRAGRQNVAGHGPQWLHQAVVPGVRRPHARQGGDQRAAVVFGDGGAHDHGVGARSCQHVGQHGRDQGRIDPRRAQQQGGAAQEWGSLSLPAAQPAIARHHHVVGQTAAPDVDSCAQQWPPVGHIPPLIRQRVASELQFISIHAHNHQGGAGAEGQGLGGRRAGGSVPQQSGGGAAPACGGT